MSLVWQQSFGKGLPCPPTAAGLGVSPWYRWQWEHPGSTSPKPLQQRASPPASVSPPAHIHCGASNLGTSA